MSSSLIYLLDDKVFVKFKDKLSGRSRENELVLIMILAVFSWE